MRRAPRVIVLVALAALVAACGSVVHVEVADLALEPAATPAQSHVYAADGSKLATLRVEHREPARPEDLSELLIDAVVAAEDRRFFEHRGIDGRAVARAALANQRAGSVIQGGSTITQQLAKNRYFPEAEETLERKAAEAHAARQLEAEMSKDEILAAYLDTVYFGAGAHGIVAAAEAYFDVTPAELSLEQAALLAGLIRSPEGASPYHDPERAREVRDDVLGGMAATGAVTRQEAAAAAAAPPQVRERPPAPPTRHPYFVAHVLRELRAEPALGADEAERLRVLYGGGLSIHTTLEPAVQVAAEAAAAEFSTDPEAPEVAVAAVRPADGHVLGVVGGRDFGEREFDLAIQGRRQPGSAFKTFALVAALDSGWRLDSELASGSAALALDGGESWQVQSSTAGPMSLRDALAKSSNGAFARLALEIGGKAIADAAAELGVTSPVGHHPAVSLGALDSGVSPLEMASAYGTLAAGGVHAPPQAIARIEGPEGAVLWQAPDERRIAVDGAVAWFATQALSDVIASGTGGLADPGRPAGGKTGTSQDHRDAWFVGATPDLAAAVWMGHPDEARTARDPATGGTLEGGGWPARIWRHTVEEALAGVPAQEFPYPAHLERTVLINPDSGGLATEWCPMTEELTGLPGELPEHHCPLHGPPEPETATPRVPAAPAPNPEPDGQ